MKKGGDGETHNAFLQKNAIQDPILMALMLPAQQGWMVSFKFELEWM